MAEGFAIAGIVVAIAGGVASADSSRKAANTAKDRAKVEDQLASAQERQQRQRMIAEARQRRAAVAALGETSAPGATLSAVQGAEGSIFSQLNANLSFLNGTSELQRTSARLGSEQASAMGRAGEWAAVSNVGFSVANAGYSKMGTKTS